MQSFSFRWMKRSPHGLAQSVTSPLHLSSSLLMGKEMRACFDLSRPCSFVSKFLKFVLCNFEYLYVMPVWGTSLKLQRCFRDSWYKLNHAPTCTAFFFFSFYLVWYENSLCFKICHSPPAVHLCYRSDTCAFHLPAQQIILNTKSMLKKKAIYSFVFGSCQQLSQTHLIVAKTESFVQHIFTFLKLSLLERPFFTWPRFDIWKCNHEVLFS